MSKIDRLIEQFQRDWLAGLRPQVEAVLDAVDASEREHVRQRLNVFVSDAPTPAYSGETLGMLLDRPEVECAAALIAPEVESLASLVRRLRWDAQLRRDDLVEILISELGLPRKRDKVKRYLHDLEAGLLDPHRLSRRLLEGLATILNILPERLIDAAAVTGDMGAPPALAYQRSYEEQPPFSFVPPGYDVRQSREESGWDTIDELFCGGR